MGYAQRYLLALTIFMLVAASALPASPQGPDAVDPPEVDLPGGSGSATQHLEVTKDSVVLSANMAIGARPRETTVVVAARPSTTLGFHGGVASIEPGTELSWFLDTPLTSVDLDSVTAADGEVLLTASPEFAFQLFLVDVAPVGLYSFNVSWLGMANATVATQTYQGATLYVLNNATGTWEPIASYSDALEEDHVLDGGPLPAPWHYINRTATEEDKVILLVVSHRGHDSLLVTDTINVTATYRTYPQPRMDVGGDGTVEWGFGTNESTGYLGHVAAFDDDTTEGLLTFPVGGGSNDDIAFLLPDGAQVDRAYVDYVAFSTKGQRTGGGANVHAPSGVSSTDLVVSGIPLLSHQWTSSVQLSSVLRLNVTEQRQEDHSSQPYMELGSGAIVRYSLAQSFTPAFSGPLTGVDVYVQGKFGTPGHIALEVREMMSGTPTGVLLGFSARQEPDVALNAWNNFPLSGIDLTGGVEYAFRLHAVAAASPGKEYLIGYNASDLYPGGQCFASTTLDGNGAWSPTGYDLAFRTYMDLPVDTNGALNLEVLGASGSLSGQVVNFAVSGFEYEAGQWSFVVDNLNPYDVTFDWSATTNYLLFAESPSLDVGGDGTVEWAGENVSATRPLDITAGVQAVMATTAWPHFHVDPFGNHLLRIPLNLSATSEGDVALRNIVVYYHGSLTSSDIAGELNARKAVLAPDTEGMVRIPVNWTSKTAGVLNVTDFHVVYDLPPYSLELPDVVVMEDGPMVGGPIHLDTVIFDDHDNNDLGYTVVREAGDASVTWNITGTNALTFSGPPEWSGWASFHILAEDTRGLVYRTNTFNVTIQAVNDVPGIVGLRDVVAFYDVEMVLPLTVVDPDTGIENINMTTDSPRVTVDIANLSLILLYPDGSASERVEVTITDGEGSAVYSFNVTAIESNEPPYVDHIPDFNLAWDIMGMLNLTPYGSDLESPANALVWSVHSFPEALVVIMHAGNNLQIIPVATRTGAHVVTLNVTDPDDNTITVTLNVTLTDTARNNPIILRGEDALPALLKVQRGKDLVVNLALQRYWYDQEDLYSPQVVQWEATSLRPNLFTVEVDGDQRLTIKAADTTGAGYFTLRLFDSDGGASVVESVQVKVYEPEVASFAWLLYVFLAVALVVVVMGLMSLSRRGKDGTPKKTARSMRAEIGPGKVGAVPAPAEGKASPTGPGPGPGPEPALEEAPVAKVPARVVNILVIHENTSLIAQISKGGEGALTDLQYDDLIEQSTLFAQERFEGVKVGTIKGFKFPHGGEVLVGKGLNYFLAVRCTGNVYEEVASEIKRSIINVDVNLAERLRKWYPGQKVAALEDELIALSEID
jgi:hypothetical protein